jgi:hypothetical protein
MSNIKARLEKLEQKQNPDGIEVVIIRFTGNGPLPPPFISGSVAVSYQRDLTNEKYNAEASS